MYSLTDCYELAFKNNVAIQKAQNITKADAIDLNTARGKLLPVVSFTGGHYFSFGKNIDPVTNTYVNENFSGGYMGLGLDITIFSGFNKLYSIKQTKYSVQASEYARKKIELEQLSNITLLFSQLLFAKEQSVILRNNIFTTSKEIEITKEKIKLGRLTKNEYYVLNARLHSEEADLVSAQNDSLTASQGLKQLLSISYKEAINIIPIDTTVLSAIFSTSISSSDFIENILQKHPALSEAKMNEQIATMQEKVAKSSLYPSLSIGGNLVSNYNANETDANGEKLPLNRQLNNNLGQNIFISLQVPVFSQREFANRIKKEKINVSNSQYAAKEVENVVLSNSLQLINDFNSAKQKYIATSAALEQNNLSYGIYEEKYRLGQVSSMELITAKEILNSSNSKYLQAKFELFFRYQLIELLKTDFKNR
jgi:outer membrane protein